MAAETQFILEAVIDPAKARAGAAEFSRHLSSMVTEIRDGSSTVKRIAADFDKLRIAQDKAAKESSELRAEVSKLKAANEQLEKQLKEARDETDKLRQAGKNLEGQKAELGKRILRLTAQLAGLTAGVEIVRRSFLASIEAASSFETGLTGVGKTTDLAGTELAALGAEIEHLATTSIPTATSELLDIAQGAGQLGVQGTENILAFVDAVGKVVPSSDLAADEAATSFARILNVTGEALGEVGRFASQVIALGNAFPAVESEILHTTNEVARAVAIFKVGSGEAAALATAFAALGIPSEIAATSAGRLFRTIQEGTRDGGPQLERIAKIAGVSGKEMKEAFERDAMGAVLLLLEGLNKLSTNKASLELEALGLSSDRLDKTLPNLISRIEVLRKSLKAVEDDAAAPVNALEREFGRYAVTFDSQLQLFQNARKAFLKDIGEQIIPVLLEIITKTREWFAANEDVAASLGTILATAVTAAAKTVALLVENLDLLLGVAVGLTAVKLAAWFAAWGITTIPDLIAGIKLLTTSFNGLNLAMLRNPLFLIPSIAAFAGVAVWQAVRSEIRETEAEISRLRMRTDELGDSFTRMMAAIREGAVPLELVLEESDKLQEKFLEVQRLKKKVAELKEEGKSSGGIIGDALPSADLKTAEESLRVAEQELEVQRGLLEQATKIIKRKEEIVETGEEDLSGQEAINRALEDQLKAVQDRLELMEGISSLIESERIGRPFGGAFEQALEKAEILQKVALGVADNVDLARLRLIESGNAARLLEAALKANVDASQLLDDGIFNSVVALEEVIAQTQILLEMNQTLADLRSESTLESPTLENSVGDGVGIGVEFELPAIADEDFDKWADDLGKLVRSQRWEVVFEGLTEGLQDAMSDTFQDVLTNGMEGFETFFEAIRDLFVDIVSEFIAAELKRVIVQQISAARAQSQAGGTNIITGLFSGSTGTFLAGAAIAANVAGARSKTNAAIATAAGAAIGAMVGAIAGGVTIAAGAKFGALIGSFLGQFINEGTPEFFAAVESELGKLSFEGSGAARVASAFGDPLQQGIDSILNEFGADLVDVASGVTLKLKNGLSVFLDGVEFGFKDDFEEGIQFAIVEILKRAQLTNLEDEVITALQFSKASDIQGLLSDLSFARETTRLTLDEIAKQIISFVEDAVKAAERARDLRISDAPIFEFLAEQLQSVRDQITGTSEDPATALARQKEAFNARILLIQAEQTAKQAELEFRRAEVAAEIELLRVESGLTRDRIEILKAGLDAEAQIVEGSANLLQAKLQQLAAIEGALQAASQILASLPDLISDEELAAAQRRLRGGGGGRGQERDALLGLGREAQFGGTAAGAIVEARLQFGDLARRVQRAGFAAEEAARLMELFEEAAAEAEKEAAESVRRRIDALGSGGGLVTELQGLQDETERLERELRLLAEIGALTSDEIADLTDRLAENAQRARETATRRASDSLLGDLLSALGREEEAARLRQELAIADLMIRREELRIAQERFGIEIHSIGLIDDLLGRIQALGPEGIAAIGRLGDATLSSTNDEISALGGGAAAGSLMQDLQRINDAADDLRQQLRDLEAAGRASAQEVDDATEALERQTAAARNASVSQAAGGLLIDLLEMAGEEEEAAQLRFEFTLMELELRREELRIALAKTELEAEAAQMILEVLGRSGELLGRIRRRGPVVSGGGPSQGQNGDGQGRSNAEEMLLRLREEAMGDFVARIRDINAQFAFLRQELGSTAEIAELHRKALEDAVDGINRSTQSLLDQITLTTPSRDPLERFLDLEQRARDAVDLALANPNDMEARRAAEDLLQQLFGAAQETLPTAGAGFAGIVEFIQESLQSFLDAELDLERLGISPLGPQSDPGFDRVVAAIDRQTRELRGSDRSTAERLALLLTAEQRRSLSDLGSDIASAIDLQGNFEVEIENLMRVLDSLTDEQIAALGGVESIIESMLGSSGPQSQLLSSVAGILRIIDANQLQELGGIGGLLHNLGNIEGASSEWLRALATAVGWENLEHLGLLDDLLGSYGIGIDILRLILLEQQRIVVPTLPKQNNKAESVVSATTSTGQSNELQTAAIRDQTSVMLPVLRDIRESTGMSADELRKIRLLLSRPTSHSVPTIGSKF